MSIKKVQIILNLQEKFVSLFHKYFTFDPSITRYQNKNFGIIIDYKYIENFNEESHFMKLCSFFSEYGVICLYYTLVEENDVPKYFVLGQYKIKKKIVPLNRFYINFQYHTIYSICERDQYNNEIVKINPDMVLKNQNGNTLINEKNNCNINNHDRINLSNEVNEMWKNKNPISNNSYNCYIENKSYNIQNDNYDIVGVNNGSPSFFGPSGGETKNINEKNVNDFSMLVHNDNNLEEKDKNEPNRVNFNFSLSLKEIKNMLLMTNNHGSMKTIELELVPKRESNNLYIADSNKGFTIISKLSEIENRKMIKEGNQNVVMGEILENSNEKNEGNVVGNNQCSSIINTNTTDIKKENGEVDGDSNVKNNEVVEVDNNENFKIFNRSKSISSQISNKLVEVITCNVAVVKIRKMIPKNETCKSIIEFNSNNQGFHNKSIKNSVSYDDIEANDGKDKLLSNISSISYEEEKNGGSVFQNEDKNEQESNKKDFNKRKIKKKRKRNNKKWSKKKKY